MLERKTLNEMVVEDAYVEAKRICKDALNEFRFDINDWLPEDDGSFQFEWNIDDCESVQKYVNNVVGVILSTIMAKHVSYELRDSRVRFAAAIEEKNIPACQNILKDAMKDLQTVFFALDAIS